ncbi:MAG: hypothetical protein K8U57_27535 [Planctomycetes bacterium]|nr:hypothetical protein [Planctomycetota bacterium]
MDLLAMEKQNRDEEERHTFEVFSSGVDLRGNCFRSLFDVDQYRFFTCDDLRTIAGEKIIRGKRPKHEEEMDEAAGVYVFTSLTEKLVLKVGKAVNLRQRVGVEHLRDRNTLSAATIREYYSRREGTWPDHLFDDQVTLCTFRMTNAPEKLLFSAELYLQAKLGHVLP